MLEGEGFIVDERKFDYFFGRVTSNLHNRTRSLDNLEGLRELGIEEDRGGRERLLELFKEGLKAPIVDTLARPRGLTIVRKVEIVHGTVCGAIDISYFYEDGNVNAIAKVVTIVTKIYPDEN
jgi:hypothetical protein